MVKQFVMQHGSLCLRLGGLAHSKLNECEWTVPVASWGFGFDCLRGIAGGVAKQGDRAGFRRKAKILH